MGKYPGHFKYKMRSQIFDDSPGLKSALTIYPAACGMGEDRLDGESAKKAKFLDIFSIFSPKKA